MFRIDNQYNPKNDIRTIEIPNLLKELNADRVHGILAAPPCTEFAGSGARWWKDKPPEKLQDALSIVDACLRFVAIYEPEWWALESPVGRLSRWLGPPKMYFQPCDYGDPYTKKTALWGRFHPPIPHPVEATEGSKMHRVWGGTDEGKRERATTPMGFARAFFDANP